MVDLEKLLAAIEETEKDALAVPEKQRIWWGQPGKVVVVDDDGWVVVRPVSESSVQHIARNDPAAVLRRCKADFRTWDRHLPKKPLNRVCTHDGQPWPCLDFRDLADRYGIAAEEEAP